MPETGLLTLDAALSLSRQEVVDLHQKYVNAGLVNLMTLIDFTKRFVKAEGFRVWDQDGQEY
ncbi:MAG TPA: putrescine aminotransferase, partial [Bacillota bacterium]|nr:putrescine aminotransferase [Bacillota bacterium]